MLVFHARWSTCSWGQEALEVTLQLNDVIFCGCVCPFSPNFHLDQRCFPCTLECHYFSDVLLYFQKNLHIFSFLRSHLVRSDQGRIVRWRNGVHWIELRVTGWQMETYLLLIWSSRILTVIGMVASYKGDEFIMMAHFFANMCNRKKLFSVWLFLFPRHARGLVMRNSRGSFKQAQNNEVQRYFRASVCLEA